MGRGSGWRLGVIAAFSVLIVVYIALQIFLFQVEEYYIPMAILILFMFSGITIKLMFEGRPVEVYTMFQNQLIWISILLIAVAFIVLKVLTIVTALSMTLPNVLFAVLAAICETWGINAGVQTAIEFISGSNWLGVFGGAGVAVGVHWAVYGQTALVLVFVFLSFFVLNMVYKLSGDRLEVPMIAHILFNVL